MSMLYRLCLHLNDDDLNARNRSIRSRQDAIRGLRLRFLLSVSSLLNERFVVRSRRACFSIFLFLILSMLLSFLRLALSRVNNLIEQRRLLHRSLRNSNTYNVYGGFRLIRVFLNLNFILYLNGGARRRDNFHLSF